jgi:hypothetical protein
MANGGYLQLGMLKVLQLRAKRARPDDAGLPTKVLVERAFGRKSSTVAQRVTANRCLNVLVKRGMVEKHKTRARGTPVYWRAAAPKTPDDVTAV